MYAGHVCVWSCSIGTLCHNYIVYLGRTPSRSHAADNAVWMMGNPNWGTINLHLGEVSIY